jgi:hypothetical protein
MAPPRPPLGVVAAMGSTLLRAPGSSSPVQTIKRYVHKDPVADFRLITNS